MFVDLPRVKGKAMRDLRWKLVRMLTQSNQAGLHCRRVQGLKSQPITNAGSNCRDENVATHMVLQHRCDRFVLIQLSAVSYPTIYVLSRTAYDLSRQLRKKGNKGGASLWSSYIWLRSFDVITCYNNLISDVALLLWYVLVLVGLASWTGALDWRQRKRKTLLLGLYAGLIYSLLLDLFFEVQVRNWLWIVSFEMVT